MLDFFKNMFSSGGTEELESVINNGAYLVDVRTPGEFSEGHVPGSVNIPLDRIQSQLAKFKGKSNIVVFCRSGMRSSQAKAILAQNGFTNVINGGTWEKVYRFVNK
ncbi:MAG: rhodanese-like domain-containing protein [Chitinophagaceae bacterium]|nr:rhodanese-like domain-containing protein [Chitinophagaceae bacterium]